MSKNKVSIDVPRLGPDEVVADIGSLSSAMEKADKYEDKVNPCRLVSRADHPIEVIYGDSVIRLSPRQRVDIADMSKLDRKSLNPLLTLITGIVD